MTGYACDTVLRWVGPVKAPRDEPWTPMAAQAVAPSDVYYVAPKRLDQDQRHFETIQAAIDQVLRDAQASGSQHRRRIEIAPGRFAGPVYIPSSAPPLTLVGGGADASTLAARIDAQMPGREYAQRYAAGFAQSHPDVQAIVDRIGAREAITTGNTAVLRIESNDAVISGLRVENTYFCDRAAAAPEGQQPDMEGRFAQGQHQAVALHIAGADRVILSALHLSSFQDTLYLQTKSPFAINRVYVDNCLIEGDVDFIFGGATVFFQDCELKTRVERTSQSWVTAPSTNIRARYGFVFDSCRFSNDAIEPEEIGSVFLGRQWFEGVRATPYGVPTHDGYHCETASISHYDGQIGTISRRTLESVGKCVVLTSDIGDHIDNNAKWDGWSTPNWSCRYRPAQYGPLDFQMVLGTWLAENSLNYDDLAPDEQWLLPR